MARAMAVVIVAVGSGYWAVAFASWLQVAVPGIAVHRHETVCFIMVWHETAARRRAGFGWRRNSVMAGLSTAEHAHTAVQT